METDLLNSALAQLRSLTALAEQEAILLDTFRVGVSRMALNPLEQAALDEITKRLLNEIITLLSGRLSDLMQLLNPGFTHVAISFGTPKHN